MQGSHLSWHWIVMQNLKIKWLVFWKMTWGIWQFFTRVLERILWYHPFVQSRKFMAENLQGSSVSWQWRMMQNLKRSWLEIWQILIRALDNLKSVPLNGFLWPKYIMHELEKYRGVMFHGTEGWRKKWKENWHVLSKLTFGKFSQAEN